MIAKRRRQQKSEALAAKGRKSSEAVARRNNRRRRLLRVLNNKVWPLIPPQLLGKRVSRRERERVLGYGQDGV